VLDHDPYALMITPRKLAEGWVKDYGCGIAVRMNSGRLVLTHSGAVSGFQAHNTVIPETRSAVVILANQEETAPVAAIESALLSLLLPKPPGPPAIAGPPALEAAKTLFLELQKGKINRASMGEEFSIFLDAKKSTQASARLKAYGTPLKLDLESSSERGGMEVTRVRFTFKTGALHTLMYRTPDGKIQEFLVGP